MAVSLFGVPTQRYAVARSRVRCGLQIAQPKQTVPTESLNSKDPQHTDSIIADSGDSAVGISETLQLLAAPVGTTASAVLRGPPQASQTCPHASSPSSNVHRAFVSPRGFSARISPPSSLLLAPQSSLVKRATAVAADAVLGSDASGPLRLQMRRRLRAAVAAIGFGLRLHATLQCLAYLSLSPCDLLTDTEALCSVDSFLGPVVPSSPLMRVTMALASITAFALKLHSASDWLQHPESAHGLLVVSAFVFDLVTSGPDLMESFKEIHVHIGHHQGRQDGQVKQWE